MIYSEFSQKFHKKEVDDKDLSFLFTKSSTLSEYFETKAQEALTKVIN